MNVCFVFDSDDDEDGGTEEETEEEEEEEEVVKPTKIKFIKGQSRCNWIILFPGLLRNAVWIISVTAVLWG